MTRSFPWSLTPAAAVQADLFHGATAMPPKIAPCSPVDGTFQFSPPGKAPFTLQRY